MRIILAIVLKEVRQLLRDRKLLMMVLVIPFVQLFMFGYVVSTDLNNVSLTVMDADKSAMSRELVTRFRNSAIFSIASFSERDSEIVDEMDRNRAAAAIVIPAGFERNLKALRKPEVGLILDGSDSTAATQAQAYAAGIMADFARDKDPRRMPAGLKVTRLNVSSRVWFNPTMKSVNHMIPGLIGLILTIVSTMLTSLAIVRERENGTLEQIIVTPIKKYQLIAGKIIPFAIISYVDVIIIVAAGMLWFKVPFRGNIVTLFLMTGAFLLCTIGQGIFISTVSRTQQQAMSSSWFILFPSMLLSGFVFPTESMPRLIYWVSYIIPLRYYLVIVRGIFVKGIGISVLWPQVLGLLILGSLTFTASVLRFHKKFAD